MRVDMVGQLNLSTVLLRQRVETLNQQMASGQRAAAIGDMATALPQALDLRAEIGRREAYGTAISQALSRTTAAQTTLGRLSEIAQEFGDKVAVKLDPNDPEGLFLAASNARAAMVEVGQLLNARYGDEYLFGGSDFASPPVPDPDNLPISAFTKKIGDEIGTLGGGNAAAVAAATKAVAQDDTAGVTPFSAFFAAGGTGLAEPPRSLLAGDGSRIEIGLRANRNTAAVSTGETTGSWARDLLRGLASIAALKPAQTSSPTDFRALADTIRNGLQSAGSALADEQGALGLTEERLTGMQTRHSELVDSLKGQLAGIEEVDLAETLIRLDSTKEVLEASYKAIGTLGSLSLVDYL